MSKPQSIPRPQDPAANPSVLPGDSIPADPLLDSDSFIDPERNNSGAESPEYQQSRNMEFGPGVVIAAEPISMLRPEDCSEEATPRSVRRRNPEEMSKRPSWLPEDWKIDLKVRSSGATAGLIDRYYVEPSGQLKFRSKNEVVHFLETGSKLKRKGNSEADGEASQGSTSQKQKKSSVKRKKPEALKSDIMHPPQVLSSVHADTPQEI